jgi:hypothetical protein
MPIIVSLPIAAAIALIFRKRIENTISLAIFLIITLLYISGIVANFTPGIVLTFLTAAVAAGYTVYNLFKDKSKFKEYLFTPGLVVFIALAVYFLLVSFGRYINHGTDEFHHWGLAAKYFYMLNDYSNVPMTTDSSPYHGPAVTLWSFFSTRFWLSCSTGMMMWGQQLLAVSLILPIFQQIDKFKSKYKILLATLFITVLPYCLRDVSSIGMGYTTLQTNTVQALLFGFALIYFMEYYQKEDRFYLALSLYAMFILPITKRTGIIDAMIFFFIIYSAMILHRKYDLKKVWKIMVMYLVLSFGSYLSWEAYIASSGGKGRGLLSAVVGIVGKLASRGALFVAAGVVVLIAGVLFVVVLQNKHPRIIVGSIAIAFSAACLLFMRSYDSPAELKEEATVMVLRSLFGFDYRGYGENIKMDVFQIGHLLPLSIGLFFVIVYLLWRYYVKGKNYAREKDLFVHYLVVLSIIGYGLLQIFRLTGAVTFMGYENQANLAIADNYIGGYFLSFILFMVYDFLTEQREKEDFEGRTALVLLAILLSFFNCSAALVSLVEKPEGHYFYALDGFEFEFGDKVFLMDVNKEAYDLFEEFYYEAAPAKIGSGTWYIEYMGDKYTIEQVSRKLIDGGYNYVYIENLGPDFKEYYADLFTDPSTIDNNHIYSVKAEGNSVKLEFVR